MATEVFTGYVVSESEQMPGSVYVSIRLDSLDGQKLIPGHVNQCDWRVDEGVSAKLFGRKRTVRITVETTD